MAGFQRALEPVSKLWKKQVETASQPDRDSTSPLGLSNLSLNEQNDSDDKAPEPNISKIHAGIALAQKLLFCSYCEADGNQSEVLKNVSFRVKRLGLLCGLLSHRLRFSVAGLKERYTRVPSRTLTRVASRMNH